MGKRYFRAGAERRPGNARPGFQGVMLNVTSAGKTCRWLLGGSPGAGSFHFDEIVEGVGVQRNGDRK